MENKKIVFFVSSLDRPGGIERVLSLISAYLYEEGYKIFILSLSSGVPFFTLPSSIEVVSLTKSRNKFSSYFKSIFKIISFLRKNKINYFICVGASLILYTFFLPLFYKFKYCLWEHFSTSYSWNKYTSSISRTLAAIFCDIIIVLNKDDYNYYIRKKSKKVITIPNPAPQYNIENKRIKQEHVILSVGRLVPVKGFDVLLKIWALVEDKGDWLLYIVGDGVERDNLSKQIKEYGLESSVRLFPATDRISDFYSMASLYVLSSRSECFPTVLLEAEQYGLPIICSDCGAGIKELVKNEVNGFIIPLDENSSFAEKLQLLISTEKLRLQYGIASKFMVKKFSKNSIIANWKSIL